MADGRHLEHRKIAICPWFLILTSGRSGAQAWAPDRPDVKI